jgi:hypothetical protein
MNPAPDPGSDIQRSLTVAPSLPALTEPDWNRLARLRELFLQSTETRDGLPDYWRSNRDLEIYDATFGARIGWKWNAVLAEMQQRKIDLPGGGTLVDWGAGTGVASRAFLTHFSSERTFRVHVHERSRIAREFAEERIAGAHGVEIEPEMPADPSVLLVSHVLDELDASGLDDLVALARRAALVVWIVSGAKHTSRALSAARERVLDALDPLLPCTHRAACGILAPDQASNWCHHFATPAPEAFTTAHWRAFSRTLGIDLRALPYSYLVLRRRVGSADEELSPVAARGGGDEEPLVRILGSSRTEKGRARFEACSAEGVRTLTILERTDKGFVRALRERSEPRVVSVVTEGDRVKSLRPV